MTIYLATPWKTAERHKQAALTDPHIVIIAFLPFNQRMGRISWQSVKSPTSRNLPIHMYRDRHWKDSAA